MFALIRVFRPVTHRLGRRSSTVSLEDFNHLREKVEKLSNEVILSIIILGLLFIV